MFTGLIRDIGEIIDIQKPAGGDMLARIRTTLDPKDLSLGASIACSGVCLTVIKYEEGIFDVQASSETLSKTKLDTWQIGTKINLEPSLRMGDDLGGHFVFGHVDGLAEVISIEQSGESYLMVIKPPPHLMKYMAVKGSVALDGTSLTVNKVNDDNFEIMIIPHTWDNTTFAYLRTGDQLHVEIDMLARYVERLTGKTE